MWHSDGEKSEWKTLEVTFPVTTHLTGIRIHSQHSGRVHPVQQFRLSILTPDGTTTEVTDQPVTSDNQLITFDAAIGDRWQLDFRPGTSGKVALRGLQFYFHDSELYAALTSDQDEAPSEDESE
ncbi:MAG: hypothetical protein R3C49_22925 [Planctomycetaceae bacterium]